MITQIRIINSKNETQSNAFIVASPRRITKKARLLLELKKDAERKEKQRDRKRKQREKQSVESAKSCDIISQKGDEDSETYKNNPTFEYITEEDFIFFTKQFDILNEQLIYQRCTSCRQVKLELKLERQMSETKVHHLCLSCKYYSIDDIRQLQQSLPVWWDDDDQIQFQLPEELIDLREGEKLMIQKYSAYIPIHHLYKDKFEQKNIAVHSNKT